MKKVLIVLLVVLAMLLCACPIFIQNGESETENADKSVTTESVDPDDEWELPMDVDDNNTTTDGSNEETGSSQTTTEDVIDVVNDTTLPGSSNGSQPTTAPSEPSTSEGSTKPTEPKVDPSQPVETTTSSKPQVTTVPEEKPTATTSPGQSSGGIELPFIPG